MTLELFIAIWTLSSFAGMLACVIFGLVSFSVEPNEEGYRGN